MEDKSKIPILKVGDKIRIKSKEWFDSQPKFFTGDIMPPKGYGSWFFNLMSKYCGKVYTIEYINSNNGIQLNDNEENWEDWMFDIVESAHEYKVGDKVRIKSKEWFDSQPKDRDGDIPSPKEYGLCFSEQVTEYCGKVYVIEDIGNDDIIQLKDNDEDWESWMFDPVEEEEKKEPQYKVGDKVVINSIDWYNANKEGCFGEVAIEGSTTHFIEDMKEYCGKVYTINERFKRHDNIYYRFEEIGYVWQSWMFSPALSNTKEDSKVSDEEERSIGDVIQFPSNSRYIIIDIPSGSKFYTTVEMSSGEIHYIDKTKSHTFAGKYLSDIDTKLDIKDRATLVRKSLNTIIEIGDVIKNEDGDHFIIIGYNSEEHIYDVVDSHWDCNRIYRTKDLTMVEKGKYKDLIDTNLSGEAIARSLRNREGVIRMSESIREADKMPVSKPYSIGDAFLGPHGHIVTIIALSKDVGVSKDCLFLVDTVSGTAAWVPAERIGKITLPNKYTSVINIHECNMDKRREEFIKYLNIQKEPIKISAKTGDIISGFRETEKALLEQLRVAHSERWAKLIAISFISKDNNSQSNFSKFDLSKVMYKSRIIK